MQIIGGAILLGDGAAVTKQVVVPVAPVVGDPNVTLGTTVSWSSNTFLYLAEGQANVTAQDYTLDTNNIVWQLFYAHKSIRLPVSRGSISASGGGARWSTIVKQNNNNTVFLYGALGGADATRTNFKSNTDTLLSTSTSFQYVANVLYQGNITTAFTVPENNYFMLGFTGGPFWKNYRRTANNYTAVSGGNAIVTVINDVYSGGWPTGPGRGIPTQLGGNTSNFTKLTGNILLAAVKFEIV